jgi:hypothetical protein
LKEHPKGYSNKNQLRFKNEMFKDKWQALYLEVVNCNMFMHNQKPIEIEQEFLRYQT